LRRPDRGFIAQGAEGLESTQMLAAA